MCFFVKTLPVLIVLVLSVPATHAADNQSLPTTENLPPPAPKHFYPLGYVPPAAPAQAAAPVPGNNARRLYPLGYIAPPVVQQIAGQKATALSLPKTAASPMPDSSTGVCTTPLIKTLVKIGLVLNTSHVNIVALDDLRLHDYTSNVELGILPASSVWRVSGEGTQLKFELVSLSLGVEPAASNLGKEPADKAVADRRESFSIPINADGYVLTCRVPDGLIGLNGKAYRGDLWLRPVAAGVSGTFSAINILNLEDYLLSVVPSEMPGNWPIEALKAQAIAARSYALANLGKHGSQGFDLTADTQDQMYSGVLAETVSGNQAVAQTAGIVIKNQGQVVPAFYHSTSGGATEIALGKNYPFLQEVADYDDASPKFTWTKKVPAFQLQEAIRAKTIAHPIGQLQSVSVVSRSPCKILISGSEGSTELSGEQMRGMFALPSSNFNVMLAGDTCTFCGRGFGHRMGLSQWGAKALAEHGYNAAQILSYYYKDVSLEYP